MAAVQAVVGAALSCDVKCHGTVARTSLCKAAESSCLVDLDEHLWLKMSLSVLRLRCRQVKCSTGSVCASRMTMHTTCLQQGWLRCR